MLTETYKITTKQKRDRGSTAVEQGKTVEAMLKVLSLRAEGFKAKAIRKATGFHPAYVSTLVSKYIHGGIEAITGIHYKGNRRNLSFEGEAALLEPFLAQAEKWQMLDTAEVERHYEQAVGHKISSGHICLAGII